MLGGLSVSRSLVNCMSTILGGTIVLFRGAYFSYCQVLPVTCSKVDPGILMWEVVYRSSRWSLWVRVPHWGGHHSTLDWTVMLDRLTKGHTLSLRTNCAVRTNTCSDRTSWHKSMSLSLCCWDIVIAWLLQMDDTTSSTTLVWKILPDKPELIPTEVIISSSTLWMNKFYMLIWRWHCD